MIFVTVGTQLPFDRLVRAVDAWAADNPATEVFAQIGPTSYRPQHIRSAPFITPQEFDEHYARAAVVVAHAGMGTILTALESGKPLLVMPRRADLGEHRNDHQLATARRFQAMGRLNVAFDAAELTTKLDRLAELRPADRIDQAASPELLTALKHFVSSGTPPKEAGRPPAFADTPGADASSTMDHRSAGPSTPSAFATAEKSPVATSGKRWPDV